MLQIDLNIYLLYNSWEEKTTNFVVGFIK